MITLETVSWAAARLGHELTVHPRGNSFIASCRCGYKSTNRRTEALAIGAAYHHMEVEYKRWRASGRSFPVVYENADRTLVRVEIPNNLESLFPNDAPDP